MDPNKQYANILDLLKGVHALVDEAMCFDPDSKYARLSDLCIDEESVQAYLKAIPECGRSAAEEKVVRPLRRWALKLAGEALAGRIYRKKSCLLRFIHGWWRTDAAAADDHDMIRVMLTIPRSVTDEFRSCVAAVGAQSDGRVDIRPDPDDRAGHGVMFARSEDDAEDDEFILMLHPFPATSVESRMTHSEVVRFIIGCDWCIEENYKLTEEVAESLAPVKLFYSPKKHKRFLYQGRNCVRDLHDH